MLRRLNLKLIILFFIALWLFGKAGEILGYLDNPVLAEKIRHAKGNTNALRNEGLGVIDMTDLEIAAGIASLAGLLIGLVIALVICKKRNRHWINAVLAVLLIAPGVWLNTGSEKYIVQLLRMPGSRVDGASYYLINGMVSILLGMLVFWFASSMREGNKNQQLAIKAKESETYTSQ